MKITCAISALLAGLVAATPTPTEDGPLDGRTVEKRATITDACPVGYCTMNGGYGLCSSLAFAFFPNYQED